ncbi:polysaccharide biosynthesis tyrosine autokinase [Candidatus Gracilibacteria bacterium]|nr:polysaccharide biosynthesis tyrosine autokinase [Candidatus Gracilibacteria bacterium]NJP20171.1 polysaccharide biosynthesis tyrosine autokinase [Hydrococcus sp. CRU_1_1]
MNPNYLKNESDIDLGYGQLVSILLRRQLWFLSVFLGVISISAIATLLMKPTYESRIQLLVEPNLVDYSERETLAGEQQPIQWSQSRLNVDYATQLTLMRSPEFLEKAVALLRPEYPDLEATDLATKFILTQAVEEDINTRIFQAVYTDSDKIKAQKVLQAMQQVYQDYNLQQENLRLTQGLAVIERQLPAARKNYLQAEEALERFRRKKNLINPEQQATALTEELNTVNKERAILRAHYQATQARYNDLQQQLTISPKEALISSRLSESSRYQNLLKEFQTTELTLAQQRVIYTDSSPVIQNLVEKRQNELALLEKELDEVLGKVQSQRKVTGEELLKEGQLGATELVLVERLVDAQTELKSLSARDRSLLQTEQKLRAQLNQFPNLIAEYDRLQPEVEIQRESIKQLLSAQQQLSLELARGGFKWKIVEAPQIGEKIAPSLTINLLLGAVIGLFLGGIVVFICEATDDKIHSVEQIKQAIDLPVLASVPTLLPLNHSRDKKERIPLLEMLNWLPFRESTDLIYTNIQLLNATSNLKSILVTSAQAGEGKSTLALGLALSAARFRKKVLLIDANLRCPSLHEQLNLPNQGGLSNLLSSLDMPKPRKLFILGLTIEVLTAGSEPDDPVKLLNSQRFGKLMSHFEQNYDLVLLDVPPILGMPEYDLAEIKKTPSEKTLSLELQQTRVGTVDVLQVASFCKGILLVTRMNRIAKSELIRAREMLGHFNAIGVIANGVKNRQKKYITHLELDRLGVQKSEVDSRN